MQFVWDNQKSEANFKKHGVRFEEAQTVFSDPYSIEFFDDAHSHKEDRFIRIGLSKKMNALLVIFCERSKKIRILSARRLTIREKKDYEEGI